MHEHSVGALRFPILVLGDAPGLAPASELATHLQARHASHLAVSAGSTPTIQQAHPLALLAGGAILALLAFAFPRLPRRPIGRRSRLLASRPPASQWLAVIGAPPPRAGVFAQP